MARDPETVMQYLTELEEKAEEILADKQQLVDLDKRKNMNREALRAINTGSVAPVNSKTKTWLNFGGMFIKVDKTAAVQMLSADQQELDRGINEIRNNLHDKVNELRDVEGQPDLQGFNLNALNAQEVKGMKTSRLIP